MAAVLWRGGARGFRPTVLHGQCRGEIVPAGPLKRGVQHVRPPVHKIRANNNHVLRQVAVICLLKIQSALVVNKKRHIRNSKSRAVKCISKNTINRLAYIFGQSEKKLIAEERLP